MTWGSHCPRCGLESCGWIANGTCEGLSSRETDDPRRDCPWKCAKDDPKCLCAQDAPYANYA